jgi:hypothetical protein
MDEPKKRSADDIEKDVIFSNAIKAGKRIYYIDVRKTRKEELYLSITESKKITSIEGENIKVSYEKHKIFLYQEDFSNFIDGLTKTMRFIHESESLKPKSENVENEEPIEPSVTDAGESAKPEPPKSNPENSAKPPKSNTEDFKIEF